MKSIRHLFLAITALSLIALAIALLVRYAWKTPALCDGCNVIIVSLDAVNGEAVVPGDTEATLFPLLQSRSKQDGTVFERAYSSTKLGWLGNASLLTGLYPWEMGMWDSRSGIPESVPTLTETLQSYGYATAGFARGICMDAPWGF